ncbi:MAG: ATP-binding protein [Pseudolysinimonas sp.]
MKRWDVAAGGLAALALVAATVQLVISVRVVPALLAENLVAIAVTVPAVVLGVVVARRLPHNAVGAVLTLTGTASLVDIALESWAVSAGSPNALPGAEGVAAVAGGTWMLHYVGPLLLALLFPTGRPLSRRWRLAVVGCFVIPVGFVAAQLLATGDAGILASLPFLAGLLALLVVAVVSVVLRYRRSDEPQRRQLRWLLVSATILPIALVICFAEFGLFGTTNGVGIALAILIVALPVSVGVAMLRHNLWGYDRVLAGTVRWAVLVAALSLVFAIAAVVLGLLFGADAPLVSAIATLVAALAFRPLQRGIRRWIDARFQPKREHLLREVRAFVLAVHNGRAEPEELETVLRRASGAGLSVRIEGVTARIDALPESGITAADLRELESEARLPLELAVLRADLREALEQTAASRSRLVAAADDERRRIQRDLHDGAQANLVALGMRLRQLQRKPGRAGTIPAAELDADIDASVELVQRTISDLRALAQGVRPSSLDEGLEPALRAMVQSVPLPVVLSLEAISVPEPSATAAYYLAAEAVTNALKHARAGRIRITLGRGSEGISLVVDDDGSGGASETIGSGLAGIRDRVEAAGGRLNVSSSVGVGTRVEAVFP